MGLIINKSKLELLKQELEKSAIRYLARYSASEATLKSILIKRLLRSENPYKTSFDSKGLDPLLNKILEDILEHFRKLGALNDTAFAEGKILTYRRMGRSRHFIQQLLLKKGIDQNIIKTIFTAEEGPGDTSNKRELEAALVFAKRRRLGPFHQNKKGNIDLRKDIAKLMRAGYSLEISRQVMGYKT